MGRGDQDVTPSFRAVFLDRDGVLNRPLIRDGRSFAPRRLEDFEIYEDAPAAVDRLRKAGFLTVLVTNQKDIGAGLVEAATVDAMHARLRTRVALDALKMCTCVDECPCYKPRPGMLLEAAEELGIDLSASVMIGDRWRDVGAGRAAGCTTVFIDRGYDEPLREIPDMTVGSLNEAADWIVANLA